MGKILALVVCIGLIFAVLPATAGEWDKATKVTFAQPVELPNIILQPGTYVFKLLDVPGNRHVVQVFNAEENEIYATILAIPNYRLTATDKTVMPFEERAPGKPLAMHAWFYPGNTFGQEFVYPKARAAEIAQEVKAPVLAAEVTPTETPEELIEEPLVAITPEQTEVEVAINAKPAEPTWEPLVTPTPPTLPVELPKTASPIPIIGLAGLASLGLSAVVRKLRKGMS